MDLGERRTMLPLRIPMSEREVVKVLTLVGEVLVGGGVDEGGLAMVGQEEIMKA
ncbi:ATP-binding protein, partial [Sesbania bispinosa]